MSRLALQRKKKQEAAKLRASHDPRMYEASEELVMDPNDSMSAGSNVNFAGDSRNDWKTKNGRVSKFENLKKWTWASLM